MGTQNVQILLISVGVFLTPYFSNFVIGVKTRPYKLKISPKDDIGCKLSKRYLSVSLNAELLQKKWYGVDFGSQKLKTLLSGLQPAYLRVSGNAANSLVYNPQVEGVQQSNLNQQLIAQTFPTQTTIPQAQVTTIPATAPSTVANFNVTQMQQATVPTMPSNVYNLVTTVAAGQQAITTTPSTYNVAQPAITESSTAPYPTQQPQEPYQQQQQQQQQQPYPTQQTTTQQTTVQQTTQAQTTQQQTTQQQTTQQQTTQQQTTAMQQQQQEQQQQQQQVQDQQQQQQQQQPNQQDQSQPTENPYNQAQNGQEQLPDTPPPNGVPGAPTPGPYKKGKKSKGKKSAKKGKKTKKSKKKKERETRAIVEKSMLPNSDIEDDDNDGSGSGDSTGEARQSDESAYQYSDAMIDKLVLFCQETGLQLIFGLNEFTREQDNSYSTNNANELLQHMITKGYNVDYELGNEPDKYSLSDSSKALAAATVGQDFAKLRAILDGATNGKGRLYGPDVGPPPKSLKFLKDFLKEGHSAVNAITWHHYYLTNTNSELSDFLNPETMEAFRKDAESVQEIVKTTKTPLWIGESGDCYDGGVEGLSNSYAAGFMFMDKLGLAALYCNVVVIKNGIIGGNDAMFGKEFAPSPNYWLAFVYKQLVGPRVLNLGGSDKLVRLYAHCAERSRLSLPKGSIVVYGLNLLPKESVSISLTNYKGKQMEEYVFTAPNANLKSQSVNLNGQLFKMPGDDSLPQIVGQKRKGKGILPPLSYGFFVIKDAGHPLC